MRRRRRARAVEALKNTAIVLLALSAVYLALRSQLSANLPGGSAAGWLGALLRPGQETGSEGESAGRAIELRPLRMAVNLRDEGRYGVQYDQAAVDVLYAETAGLLRDSLDSAGAPARISEQVWREALSERTGVFFDFQGQTPLEALRASLSLEGGESPLPDSPVRRLLLAEDGDGTVILYYSNDSEGSYYACSTSAALKGHLQSTLSGHGVNGAVFAFEGEYEGLSPYVLITAPSTAPVYSVRNPVLSMDEGREALLEGLGFHPQASSSFSSGGSLVVSEWPDRLTISDSGRVAYETTAGESPKYPVGDGVAEVIQATWQLAETALEPWRGDARLYLMDVEEQSDGAWRADYGYSLDGVPVELGGEGYAARFLVQDRQITGFTLTLRSYEAAGAESLILPEPQAAAAMEALGAEGRELRLVYEDGGADGQLAAGWVAG